MPEVVYPENHNALKMGRRGALARNGSDRANKKAGARPAFRLDQIRSRDQ
jgi:hypothetical protein